MTFTNDVRNNRNTVAFEKWDLVLSQKNKNKKNKNIFISINNDIANLYIEENYTNVNIAIMVISIRVMIIKYNIQN